MIISQVSWSLLVRKTSSILFFLIGSSIYCCKHCSCANYKRHLLEPDLYGLHRLLFPFASQLIGKFRFAVNMIFGIGFPISISFVLNSFKGLLNISVGQSGGWYTLITILHFFMCMIGYYELDFAISCSALAASVTLM